MEMKQKRSKYRMNGVNVGDGGVGVGEAMIFHL
jgi:hypothetical protein